MKNVSPVILLQVSKKTFVSWLWIQKLTPRPSTLPSPVLELGLPEPG